MPSDFGLPDLLITGERETWGRVTIEGEPTRVTCPKCDSSDGLSDPAPWKPVTIADTPSRGRPTELLLTQFRYHCSPCNCRFVAGVRGINGPRGMTERLVRYIENETPRRPRKAIAAAVGVTPDRVDRLARDLGARLARHHRFPTPRVLGVDDIKMNGKTYHLFTNSETGHGVGFVEASEGDALERWVADHLQPDQVRVIVTDMGAALMKLAGSGLLNHAIHVVDRWHVLQGCQKAMSRVIAQELAKLDTAAAQAKARGTRKRNNEPRRRARTLRNLRRDLLGRRRGQRAPDDRSLFDGRLIEPVLADPLNERLSRAFWARIDLARVHRCDSVAEARDQLERFHVAAAHPAIAAEFKKIGRRVKRYERQILAYFDAKALLPDVDPAALTTSSTERRNGIFRASWKAGRGATNFDYLRLLALYQPWQLDVDIVECGEPGCSVIEGPHAAGLASDQPLAARAALRCSAHRVSASVRNP